MLKHVALGAACCVLAPLAVVPLGPDENPSEVSIGGSDYEVTDIEHHIWLVEPGGVRARDLGYGTRLLRWDFTGDGVPDLGVFTDERDGFRRTFAYLTIYANDGTRLDKIEPVEAKWKEGHWAWIDLAQYPGLDPRTTHGALFTRYMQQQDAERY